MVLIRGRIADAGAALKIDQNNSAFLFQVQLPVARQPPAIAAGAVTSAIVGDIDLRRVAGMTFNAQACRQAIVARNELISLAIVAGSGGADVVEDGRLGGEEFAQRPVALRPVRDIVGRKVAALAPERGGRGPRRAPCRAR